MNCPRSPAASALHCLALCIASGLLVVLVLTTLVLVLAPLARAAVTEDAGASASREGDPGAVGQGTLLFHGEAGFTSAPVLHTDVHMDVSGMIARVRVRQQFSNPGSDFREGIYVFPLPETGAVDHLRMHIGERIIEGRIRERQQARREYREARAGGRRASLVEQERPNVFTTSLANIGPGETITVEIEYQQVVTYDAGGFSLRFPLVVAPRYIPGTTRIEGFAGSGWSVNTNQVPDAARITPPVRRPGAGPVNPVAITAEVDAGFPLERIESPYHPITVSNSGTAYSVALQEGDVPADRDFVLRWQPVLGSEPAAALFRQGVDGAEYALLMVLPPERKQTRILRREIIFVIDTSGSMAGASITQARAALELALERLRPGDSFNIIQFNSHTSQLFRDPELLTGDSLREARRYVGALNAGGGTEMAPAIRAALMEQGHGADIRQVVFLTDGSVGNEEELFNIIERLLGASRLFTVGIGSAPNSHFMRRAARFGRGTHTYIGDLRDVREQMALLFGRLENPVLADITLSWTDAGVESWPGKIPDLYQGEPLLISLRAAALPQGLRINGRVAGAPWEADISLQGGEQRPGVAVLWARRKIEALLDQQGNGAEGGDVRRQIVDTALAHHLVSKFTSLVAVDVTPVRDVGQALASSALPVNLPAGMRYEKVFGTMPRTATPAGLLLFAGAVLLMAACLLCRRVAAAPGPGRVPG